MPTFVYFLVSSLNWNFPKNQVKANSLSTVAIDNYKKKKGKKVPNAENNQLQNVTV